jgi:hypothetical protein
LNLKALRIMKKLLTLLLGMAVLSHIQAQGLVLEYDFIHDKFTYLQNGKEVAKPNVRKGNEVKVHVKNLNPFVFIARCDWKDEVVEDNSTLSGIASMFAGFGGGAEAQI